jgi:CIC family chloride channel protein
MKVGAMLGLCFGLLLNLIFPGTPIGLYALVGAGALIGGTFSAPLAGAIILFEISRNYTVLLPLLFASVFAHFIVHRTGISTFNPLGLSQTSEAKD